MISMIKHDIKIDESFYKVEEIRQLTDETFSLKLPKARFPFKAGQHISLGIKGDYQSYSLEYTGNVSYGGYSNGWLKNFDTMVRSDRYTIYDYSGQDTGYT